MHYSNMWELAFALASFATGILSLLLAITVVLGNPRLKENRSWALASLSVAVWAGGLGFAILAADKEQSLFWNQIFYCGGVWVPTTFLWFVSIFTKKPISKLILFGAIIISFILTVILVSQIEWFIVDLVPRGPFRYWESLGPAYHLFSLFFFLGMLYSISHLYKAMKNDQFLEKQKLLWVLVGMGVGVFGGSTNFFYDYSINIPPFGQFLVFLYPLLMSWAIVRYQALDVRILFRKTGLLVGIYLLLILLVAPVLFLLQGMIGLRGAREAVIFFLSSLIVGVILSLAPFAYAYFVQRSRFFHEHTLAGIAHELKSPLAIIESALEVLTDSNGLKKSAAVQKDYLEMIERNTSRLQLYVNDLLQVFNLQGKKLPLKMDAVDIRSVCDKVVDVVRPLALAKGLKLATVYPDQLDPIRIDSEKIEKVVSNLLSNALKFTDKGEIELLVIVNGNNGITIKITDTGKGIPKEDVPFIFERFYQGAAGRSAKGTGLGLAIARAWVEAHGGSIHAESRGAGKGSCLWFSLPK
ncbi:MAG: Adaptive-response sensory-kinase SasA [Elusimicrobia bacterium]|nr:Adaptive-response sensory-kinase SasA [Elusimicrobiota bacterium]